MLKRIFTIALLTGAGQVFVIFALKHISQQSSPEQIKAIGQIDSLVLFIMNIIAMGLQPAAMRNLALTDNWEQEYRKTQSARFTLSIFLILLTLLAFTDHYYLAFLLAPLLALSGDYALYGRGSPVKGAVIAFVRAVFPFAIVILLPGNENTGLQWFYLAALITSYFITDLFISAFLHQTFIPVFDLKSLKKYISTLSLGLVSLCLYFIGMGVLLVAQYFYPSPVLATAFVGLKFYVIFKGVLRIIQQAFLKEMQKDKVCLKIDQLSSLLGLSFLTFVLFFPDTFTRFLFGEKYIPDKNYFILVSIAAFVYSMFSSFTTKAMLDKKDNSYAVITTMAALLTLVACFLLSFFNTTAQAIGLSILTGEISFAIGMLWLMKRKQLFFERIFFIAANIPLTIIPLSAMLFVDDNIIVFLAAAVIFAGVLFLVHRKRFSFFDIS
jgi:hypothetical protein